MTPSLSQTVIEQFNSFAQSGIISPKILVLSAVPETPSKSQHQIVWIVKVVQFVAYVDEKVFVYVGFQRQSLIESFQLFAFIDDVASKAYVDGEIGMTNSALRESPAPNCSARGGR